MDLRTPEPLKSALRGGAASTASEIWSILAGTANPAAYGLAPDDEYISRLYASALTLRQRAVVRDALLLLLEDAVVSAGGDDHDRVVQIARMVGEISWFTEAGPAHLRRIERLWRSALELGRTRSAGVLLLALAQRGPKRTSAYWINAAELVGTTAQGAAFDGILRNGLAEAFEWFDTTVDPERFTAMMSRTLPRIARESLNELWSLLYDVTNPLSARFRTQTITALHRYGFTEPTDHARRSGEWKVTPDAATRHETIAESAASEGPREVGARDYNSLNATTRYTARALFAAYSVGVDEEVPSDPGRIDQLLRLLDE